MNILRRARQMLRFGDGAAGPRFIISSHYQIGVPFPEYDSRRPFRILNYLENRHLLRPGMLCRPRAVSVRRLQRVHDAAYVQSLQDPAAMEAILGFRLDNRTQDEFLAFQRLMCGGTLRAARNAVVRGNIAVNLGGGLHHAARAVGSGFCVFNDVALAIDHIRELGHGFPILVIDLDLHDGDGTRAIFADDPTVHTFSIHNKDLGTTTAVASTSIALGTGVEDATYLAAVREHLPPVVDACRPGLVFYLAGSDPGRDDRLGDWRITMEGMLERDRFVMGLLRPQPSQVNIPTAILLAGGYGPMAWRHGAAFFSWLLTGNSRLDIPLEMELPVDHYRRLARHMKHPGLLPGEQDESAGSEPDDWGLTEADLGGAASSKAVPGPGSGLFLGLYSRHGLEVVLESAGLMDRLHQRGFEELAVELDLDDPLGHTLRIVTGHPRPAVVFEVKLRVARAPAERHRDFLVVEWLLVQDPRQGRETAAANGPARPLLPGQRFRGMGLLRDMAAVLVVAAERLSLDGLLFTPSHFHLARLARPLGRFVAPADEARFLAIAKAVKGMELQEASAAVSAGRVRDAATGETITWQPRPMIIPVRAALQEELRSDPYRSAVTEAGSGLEFRLAAPDPLK